MGGHSDGNSVGGQFTMMVSMLLFRTTSTSGMRQRFDLVSIHPHRISPLDTVMMVLFASYIFTSSLSKMVI